MFALKRCEAAAPVSSRGTNGSVILMLSVSSELSGMMPVEWIACLRYLDRVRGLRYHVQSRCGPRGAASGALRVSGLSEWEKGFR